MPREVSANCRLDPAQVDMLIWSSRLVDKVKRRDAIWEWKFSDDGVAIDACHTTRSRRLREGVLPLHIMTTKNSFASTSLSARKELTMDGSLLIQWMLLQSGTLLSLLESLAFWPMRKLDVHNLTWVKSELPCHASLATPWLNGTPSVDNEYVLQGRPGHE